MSASYHLTWSKLDTESLLWTRKWSVSSIPWSCADCETHELVHLMHTYNNYYKKFNGIASLRLRPFCFICLVLKHLKWPNCYRRAGLSSWHCSFSFQGENVTLSAWLTLDIAVSGVALAAKVLMLHKIRVCGQMQRVQPRVINCSEPPLFYACISWTIRFSCPGELTFIAANGFSTADAVGDSLAVTCHSLRSTVKHLTRTCSLPWSDQWKRPVIALIKCYAVVISHKFITY